MIKKGINRKNNPNNLIDVINALEQIRDNDFVKDTELFGKEFERIINRLKDDSFRLAVVGEFSSGKSTFLNALIGKDLLKHGAKETTATITEIHNINTESKEMYLDVYFANHEIRRNVPSDKIAEYTATASTIYSVAKEIDKVVINSRVLESGANVCFVDTPGLNGVVDNHREKTIDQIKNAHACIYLMQVRGLGKSDIDFLNYIAQYQHNIVFVQNFIDELKRLEGETPEQKVEEQKRIIEEKIVSRNKAMHYKIVAVSSRKALIARSESFTTYNGETLTEKLREKLYEESRFNKVFSVINELMENNEKEKIQQKDAVSVALNILEQLKTVVSFENEKDIIEWENSVDGRKSENYSKLRELLLQNKEIYVRKLQNYVEAETSEIRKESKRTFDAGIRNIESSIRDALSEISQIDEFEDYVRNSLTRNLYQNITALEENSARHMNVKFENMVTNAVLRIKQYTGAEVNSVKPEKFETVIIEPNVKSFAREEDEIIELRQQLARKRVADRKADNDIGEKRREITKIDDELERQRKQIVAERSNRTVEINRLGTMPDKEIKYRPETHTEDRGGLGILDALFGPKIRTELVPYSDDSEQQKWKKQKSDIENKYRERESQIKAQSRTLEMRKKQYSEDIKYLEKNEAVRKRDIQSTQSLLEMKIEYLNMQKEKVRQEYLREVKKSLLENVHNYLYETISGMLFENSQNTINENCKRAEDVIMSLFYLSFDNRISLLGKLLGEINSTKDYEKTSLLLNTIHNTTLKLEAFLCQ